MELRHLRYFLAAGEALNFTKAAARLRVTPPTLSRQVKNLQDQIGVKLVRCSPRGVKLTAEGRLFLEEVRELLKRIDESVKKVRALGRGEYRELRVGYRVPTMEILLPGFARFQEAAPDVKVLLHDLSFDELIGGLRNATLELAIIFQPTGEQIAGIEFESLRTCPYCVALTARHPFAQLKSVALEEVAAEPLLGLRRKDYREHLERLFAPTGVKPRIAAECDTFSSLLHPSGSRARHRIVHSDLQTRGFQTPPLPPTHRHSATVLAVARMVAGCPRAGQSRASMRT
jgi:DNA-binding transcriptional LysR family regulator